MKNGVTTVDAPQTPQWLTVDLGEDVTEPVAIEAIKLWYNMKVWPMVYEIQTSSDNGLSDDWATLVRVERAPFNGAVKNGEGQDIADETNNGTPATAANTDTITKTTSPALGQGAAVERYVRFYVEKTNAAAPGNNVCLREISIYKASDEPQPEPGEDAWNLALGQPTEASTSVEGTSPANVVDGSMDSKWNSGDLKNFTIGDNSKDDEEQTHQWIQIDLGATGSTLEEIRIFY